MSATATLDPALAIRAAVRDLYDQLKEIVDRGPTDDPRLLDEIRAITRRDGGRITRAMKKLVAAETPTPAPAKQPSDQPADKPSQATPAATTTPAKQAAPAKPASTPVPAAKPTGRERATVRLPEPTPTGRTPRPTSPAPRAPMLSSPAARWTPPVWVWPVLLLAAVLGVLEGVIGGGWSGAGAVLAAVAAGAAVLVGLRTPRAPRFLNRKITR